MPDRWLYAWGLGSVSFGGASLLIPLYIVQLGATPVQLGYLAATAAVIGAPGAIVFGRLANRVGTRRSLVVLTLTTVGIAMAAVPLLTDVTAVIVANAALWLAVASVVPVLTMLIVEDARESAWSTRIGRLNAFQGYGWAGGLVVGAVWPVVGGPLVGPTAATRVLFWLLAACALASAAGAARWLPRPTSHDHVTRDQAVRRIARLVSRSRQGVKGTTFVFAPNRLYWLTRGVRPRRLVGRIDRDLATYLAAAGLFFTGFSAFWAPLPLFLTDVGYGTGRIFGLYLVASLASAILYAPAGRIASRFDLRLLQSGALALRGLLFPAVVLLTAVQTVALELGAVAVAVAAIGLTWAVVAVAGTAIVTRLAPVGMRGDVLGIHAALGAVAGGLGAVLGGWAAGYGYDVAYAVAGGLVVLGAGLILTVGSASGDAGTSRTAGAATDEEPGIE